MNPKMKRIATMLLTFLGITVGTVAIALDIYALHTWLHDASAIMGLVGYIAITNLGIFAMGMAWAMALTLQRLTPSACPK